MQALAAKAVFVTRICTRTVLLVDFRPGTLVLFFHATPLLLTITLSDAPQNSVNSSHNNRECQ